MDWKITAISLTRVGPDQSYILEIHKNHFKQVITGKTLNNIDPYKKKRKTTFLLTLNLLLQKKETSYSFELNHKLAESKVSPREVLLQVAGKF